MELNRRTRAKHTPLLLLTVVVHILVFLTVVDIYLTIPSEDGMKHYKAKIDDPPAKRLVFILVDDLQTSSLYTMNMSSATPYLYSVTKNRASWGVAHTQAPTESKPGHVSLLSGMYVNPIEILKIWKGEALKFDTVLSQSKKSIIFGTSEFIDSLNIYYFIHVKFYPHDEVIFEEKNAIGTQQWAFKKAQQYLNKSASTRSTNGMIILLHLTAKNK
ncbi:GPI ethanolamine phosphate transferase 1-like [Agrilus planipennis]|uniref:GPI ethanolamine phosphate transferase 1 n=1 Tax=Agrilus planipennis TaxID=224129 RepID=A0A7F5RD10_AGRPL|nr:GPI ethanolamine phosphate transferase 1-like [Agrilus planipennis]